MSKLACFFGVHEWEILAKGQISYINGYGRPTGATGRYYDLRCKCCGKIKTKNT